MNRKNNSSIKRLAARPTAFTVFPGHQDVPGTHLQLDWLERERRCQPGLEPPSSALVVRHSSAEPPRAYGRNVLVPNLILYGALYSFFWNWYFTTMESRCCASVKTLGSVEEKLTPWFFLSTQNSLS